MSYLTQMAGLAVQNFVSAAVGISVAVALIRGLARRRAATIGNFWVDLVRTCVRILLPLAVVLTVVLVSQGAIQTLRGPETATTLEAATQSIPGGPFAGQEAIKELGTNGGGTLNANSAHTVRQPERVHEPPADGLHPAHPVRAHLRLRTHGQGPEAGLGRVRRHVPAVGRLGRGRPPASRWAATSRSTTSA